MAIRIVDVIDDPTFALLPPCADPGFDHRSCDYWEDADRGSKAARASWFGPQAAPEPPKPSRPRNPFGGDDDDEPAFNPFAPARRETYNPFLAADDEAPENPFAPQPKAGPVVAADAPPKLRLLARGLAVFGSYAKVLLEDDEPAAYAQFGPLSAYPRALRTRDLYPRLPSAPLPAVITCIATTAAARDRGLAAMLVEAVCDDLAGRGFAAVETYPQVGAKPDATSAADPAFWQGLGLHRRRPGRALPGHAARARVMRARRAGASAGVPCSSWPPPHAATPVPTTGPDASTAAPTAAVSPARPSDVPVSAVPGTPPPGVAVEDPSLIAVLPADGGRPARGAGVPGVCGRDRRPRVRRQRGGRGVRGRRRRQRPVVGHGGPARARRLVRGLVPRLAGVLRRGRLRPGRRRRRHTPRRSSAAGPSSSAPVPGACGRITHGSRAAACSSRRSPWARSGTGSSSWRGLRP